MVQVAVPARAAASPDASTVSTQPVRARPVQTGWWTRTLSYPPRPTGKAVLRGQVLDVAGQPIANASVCALPFLPKPLRELTDDPACGHSGPDGGYDVPGLSAGLYTIAAWAEGSRRRRAVVWNPRASRSRRDKWRPERTCACAKAGAALPAP
jgi:hypothetical protein